MEVEICPNATNAVSNAPTASDLGMRLGANRTRHGHLYEPASPGGKHAVVRTPTQSRQDRPDDAFPTPVCNRRHGGWGGVKRVMQKQPQTQ